jgi:hypothetical protein
MLDGRRSLIGENFLYVFKGRPLRGRPAAGSTAPGMRPVPADPVAPARPPLPAADTHEYENGSPQAPP